MQGTKNSIKNTSSLSSLRNWDFLWFPEVPCVSCSSGIIQCFSLSRPGALLIFHQCWGPVGESVRFSLISDRHSSLPKNNTLVHTVSMPWGRTCYRKASEDVIRTPTVFPSWAFFSPCWLHSQFPHSANMAASTSTSAFSMFTSNRKT